MVKLHGVIYAFIDPRTNTIRYIGQTTYAKPEQRLAAHLAPSMLKKHSYLSRWLKGLVDAGLKPEMVLIDAALDQAELDRLEIEHIARYRAEGFRLVNMSAGGGGRFGSRNSPEAYGRTAKAHRGTLKPKSPEWRAHLAKVMAKRRTNTQEHMDKLHALRRGAKHTEETKAQMSAAAMGRPSAFKGHEHSPEANAKNAAAHVGLLAGEKHHQWDDNITTEMLVEMLDSGMTKVQIAEKVGKSPTFVHRRFASIRAAGHPMKTKPEARKGIGGHTNRRRGADHPMYRGGINDEEIKRLRTEGLSSLEISKQLGCSEALVRAQQGFFMGHTHSEETKAKIAATKLRQVEEDRLAGRKRTISEEKIVRGGAHYNYDASINNDELVAMRKSGMTVEDIALKIGKNQTFVYRRLKAGGYKSDQ